MLAGAAGAVAASCQVLAFGDVVGEADRAVISRDGRIAYKLVGPITAENLARTLGPEIEKALR